jgi:hypothetical protein
MRATLRLSSPAWLASPSSTSSIASPASDGIAVQQRPDRDSGQVIGAHLRQRPAIAADGRAHPVTDHGLGHGHVAVSLKGGLPPCSHVFPTVWSNKVEFGAARQAPHRLYTDRAPDIARRHRHRLDDRVDLDPGRQAQRGRRAAGDTRQNAPRRGVERHHHAGTLPSRTRSIRPGRMLSADKALGPRPRQDHVLRGDPDAHHLPPALAEPRQEQRVHRRRRVRSGRPRDAAPRAPPEAHPHPGPSGVMSGSPSTSAAGPLRNDAPVLQHDDRGGEPRDLGAEWLT